jgi:hypothetical protein
MNKISNKRTMVFIACEVGMRALFTSNFETNSFIFSGPLLLDLFNNITFRPPRSCETVPLNQSL